MAAGKYSEWLEPQGLATLQAMAAEGLDYGQMAQQMGISESTLREWRKIHPAISAALKRGRIHAIAEVENSLHRRATGYTIEVRKPIKVKRIELDPKTGRKLREIEEIQLVPEELHVPADTTAAIFYLTNRKPEAWRRNGAEVMISGEDNGTGVLMLPERAAEGPE